MHQVAVLACTLALAACASPPEGPPDHTLLLGEVARIASRTDLVQGFRLGVDDVPSPAAVLKRCGFADEDLQDRRFAVVRFYYFWHNTAAGVVHGSTHFAAVPAGTAVRSGHLVEIDVSASPVDPNVRCATIHAVRAENLESAGCAWKRNQRSGFGAAMGALSPIGGAGSASIDCATIEGTGWELVPFGPYDARVWRKLPAR